jgi:hypothetical protein
MALAGVLQSRVLRGRVLRAVATAARSLDSVPRQVGALREVLPQQAVFSLVQITREERITTQRRTTKETRAAMKAGIRIQTPEEALKAVLVRDENLTALSLRVADSTLGT